MTKKQIPGWVVFFFCLGLGSTVFAESPAGSQPGINVVLISLDSAAPEKSAVANSGGWRQWEGDAPKLLASLEGEAGLVRGDVLHPTSTASLFAFPCTSSNLGDNDTSAALQGRLGGIFNATQRPSLLLLWQKSSGAVALTIYDGTIESLQRSLPLLQNSLGDSAGGMAPGAGILPPCVFASKTDALPGGVSSGKLDAMVGAGNRDQLLNLLAVQEFQTQQMAAKSGKDQFIPAGTAIELETLQEHLGQLNNAINLLYNVAGKDMPLKVAVPLSFAAPLAQDSEAIKNGKYNLLTSQGLEAFGKFGLDVLPGFVNRYAAKWNLPADFGSKVALPIAGLPDFIAGISSQVSRGSQQPTVAEITHYVDGTFNYVMEVVGGYLGGTIGGEPGAIRGAAIAQAGGNLVKEFGQKATYQTFDMVAMDPVVGKSIDLYMEGLQAGFAHHVPMDKIQDFSQAFPDAAARLGPVKSIGLDNFKYVVYNTAQMHENALPQNTPTGSSASINRPIPPLDHMDTQPPKPMLPALDNTKYYPIKTPMAFGGGGSGGGGGTFSGGGPGGGPPGGGARMPDLMAPSPRLSDPTINALRQFSFNSPFPSYLAPTPMQMPAPRPGGILFSPDLEIVVDKTGATASRAEEAVAAIKGKVGSEFTTANGEHFIAVSQPGSAKFFQVQTGQFHVMETDLESAAENGRSLRLARFYDSREANFSELGRGWSFLPYSLRIGSPTRFGKDGLEVASKPILIDREQGVEIPYQMITSDDSENSATTGQKPPSYIAVQPGIQPYLTANAEGGYTLTFAHGLQIGFGKNGRLEWLGHNETDRVHYAFDGNNLARIFSSTAEIRLKYNASSHLTGAEITGGNSINYQINDAGQLADITVGDRASQSFVYGSDDRLKTVAVIAGDGSKQTMVDNTYDNLGRMLTHKTPDEGWSIKYNDEVGSTVKTDDSGHSITHYYDGNSRIIASGESPKSMLLFNYDIYGRVIQVAEGELLNDPSGNERPRFRVTKILADLTTNPTTTANQG